METVLSIAAPGIMGIYCTCFYLTSFLAVNPRFQENRFNTLYAHEYICPYIDVQTYNIQRSGRKDDYHVC